MELIQENHSRLQNWLNNANEDIEKRQQQEWAQCIGERTFKAAIYM